MGNKARREAELRGQSGQPKVENKGLQLRIDDQARVIIKLQTENEKLKSRSGAAKADHQALEVKYESLSIDIRGHAEVLGDILAKLNKESRSTLEKIRKIGG